MRDLVRDRGAQAMAVLLAAAAGGFLALGLSWAGASGRADVGLQIPFVVSGAFGGVALAGACLGIAAIQLDRRHRALERVHLDRMVSDVAAFSESLPSLVTRSRNRRGGASAPGLLLRGRTVHRPGCRYVAGLDLPGLDPGSPGQDRDLRWCRVCQADPQTPAARRARRPPMCTPSTSPLAPRVK